MLQFTNAKCPLGAMQFRQNYGAPLKLGLVAVISPPGTQVPSTSRDSTNGVHKWCRQHCAVQPHTDNCKAVHVLLQSLDAPKCGHASWTCPDVANLILQPVSLWRTMLYSSSTQEANAMSSEDTPWPALIKHRCALPLLSALSPWCRPLPGPGVACFLPSLGAGLPLHLPEGLLFCTAGLLFSEPFNSRPQVESRLLLFQDYLSEDFPG
mmetsp:Transcript_23339/g.66469  ORF Transcript_23339/g.66469 Transcript_23339/m.66469 type:complete len:209 (-) Transcript_23339:1037-1663(-)